MNNLRRISKLLYTQTGISRFNTANSRSRRWIDIKVSKHYSTADEGRKHLFLNIDASAVERLKTICLQNNEFLRVLVEGGGCSGFQYKFEVDDKIDIDEDMTFEKDSVKIIADVESVKILNGATIEYHEDLIRAGFRVADIPQAEKGCSCGVSFSVKL